MDQYRQVGVAPISPSCGVSNSDLSVGALNPPLALFSSRHNLDTTLDFSILIDLISERSQFKMADSAALSSEMSAAKTQIAVDDDERVIVTPLHLPSVA